MEGWKQFLEERERRQLLRRLVPSSGRAPALAVRDGREYVDFSSNDYLGLSSHPVLVAAAREALDRYGVGSGASRLMSGDLAIHHELEDSVAVFKGSEAALVFNSGYQANTGILPALFGRRDAVFADQLCHASQLDGALLSRAKLLRFRHNDPEHLDRMLVKHRGAFERALVMTESVFSMDGDLAPLSALLAACRRHRCLLMVDEAHATGVFGPQGRGCVEAEGLAAPQGRAGDVAFKGEWALSPRVSLSAGIRLLEGGADNDEVYNFATFVYAVGGVSVRF